MPKNTLEEPQAFDFRSPLIWQAHSRGGPRALHDPDPDLRSFFLSEIEEAWSNSIDPPACFHCHSLNTVLRYKGRPPGGTPYFTCNHCTKGFSRRTGTPFEGFRKRDKLEQFVHLLSQQISVAEASRQLSITQIMTGRWLRIFSEWLQQRDPSGRLSAKIRLGQKPPLSHMACPKCGQRSNLSFYGLVTLKDGHTVKRQVRCQACGKHSRLDAIDDGSA